VSRDRSSRAKEIQVTRRGSGVTLERGLEGPPPSPVEGKERVPPGGPPTKVPIEEKGGPKLIYSSPKKEKKKKNGTSRTTRGEGRREGGRGDGENSQKFGGCSFPFGHRKKRVPRKGGGGKEEPQDCREKKMFTVWPSPCLERFFSSTRRKGGFMGTRKKKKEKKGEQGSTEESTGCGDWASIISEAPTGGEKVRGRKEG